MSKEELIREMIDRYTDLQRIMKSDDPQREMANPKKALESKLQALGVVTENIQFD